HELGRAQDGLRHGPRAIDIDILLLGTQVLEHERMKLPHEQLLSRRFVLIPALELDFELTAPDGRRLADALAALPLQEGVRWAGPPPDLPRGRAPGRAPAGGGARGSPAPGPAQRLSPGPCDSDRSGCPMAATSPCVRMSSLRINCSPTTVVGRGRVCRGRCR